MRIRALFFVSLLPFSVACGSSSSDEKGSSNRPPVPENGIQIALPQIELPPGSDKQFCWYTTVDTAQDYWVQGYEAFQGKGGHHIIAFSTDQTTVPDGTIVDCTDGSQMAQWRPLLLAQEVHGLHLPDGYGIKLPAKSRLVIQTHYINTTTKTTKTSDYVNIYYNADQSNVVGAAPFANSDLDFTIPASSDKTVKYECVAEQDMNVFSLLGHMHQYGTAFYVEVGQPGALNRIYDYPQWQGPDWRDTPPIKTWPLDTPFVLKKGDLVHVSCTWSNSTQSTLQFPKEMCASVFWFYPGESSITCGGTEI